MSSYFPIQFLETKRTTCENENTSSILPFTIAFPTCMCHLKSCGNGKHETNTEYDSNIYDPGKMWPIWRLSVKCFRAPCEI